MHKILAFDLGAESGRGVLGRFDGHRLQLDVVHRFPNNPVRVLDALHWDVLNLFHEMLQTLRRAAAMGLERVGFSIYSLPRDVQARIDYLQMISEEIVAPVAAA